MEYLIYKRIPEFTDSETFEIICLQFYKNAIPHQDLLVFQITIGISSLVAQNSSLYSEETCFMICAFSRGKKEERENQLKRFTFIKQYSDTEHTPLHGKTEGTIGK